MRGKVRGEALRTGETAWAQRPSKYENNLTAGAQTLGRVPARGSRLAVSGYLDSPATLAGVLTLQFDPRGSIRSTASARWSTPRSTRL
jgi:hypothetical protein